MVNPAWQVGKANWNTRSPGVVDDRSDWDEKGFRTASGQSMNPFANTLPSFIQLHPASSTFIHLLIFCTYEINWLLSKGYSNYLPVPVVSGAESYSFEHRFSARGGFGMVMMSDR